VADPWLFADYSELGQHLQDAAVTQHDLARGKAGFLILARRARDRQAENVPDTECNPQSARAVVVWQNFKIKVMGEDDVASPRAHLKTSESGAFMSPSRLQWLALDPKRSLSGAGADSYRRGFSWIG